MLLPCTRFIDEFFVTDNNKKVTNERKLRTIKRVLNVDDVGPGLVQADGDGLLSGWCCIGVVTLHAHGAWLYNMLWCFNTLQHLEDGQLSTLLFLGACRRGMRAQQGTRAQTRCSRCEA